MTGQSRLFVAVDGLHAAITTHERLTATTLDITAPVGGPAQVTIACDTKAFAAWARCVPPWEITISNHVQAMSQLRMRTDHSSGTEWEISADASLVADRFVTSGHTRSLRLDELDGRLSAGTDTPDGRGRAARSGLLNALRVLHLHVSPPTRNPSQQQPSIGALDASSLLVTDIPTSSPTTTAAAVSAGRERPGHVNVHCGTVAGFLSWLQSFTDPSSPFASPIRLFAHRVGPDVLTLHYVTTLDGVRFDVHANADILVDQLAATAPIGQHSAIRVDRLCVAMTAAITASATAHAGTRRHNHVLAELTRHGSSSAVRRAEHAATSPRGQA